jgi:hypothetical protein
MPGDADRRRNDRCLLSKERRGRHEAAASRRRIAMIAI